MIDFSRLGNSLTLPSSQAEAADSLQLNLFDDVVLTAILDKLEVNSSGSVSWIGHVVDEKYSQVILTVKDRVMQGMIVTLKASYQVRYVGGVHAIDQIDQSRFPAEREPTAVEQSSLAMTSAINQPMTDDGSIIDVFVAYTTAAQVGAGGNSAMLTLIDLAINETNTSYANSGITQRLNLVSTSQVSYTESGDIQLDRDRLQNPSDGYMDSVHSLRDFYGADLVALIVENGGGYCGISYIMNPVSVSFANYGFEIVARDCATGNYTFGHELGHIMSARHDWYVDPTNNSPYTYNHGYINSVDQWRTMMAYNNACSDYGFNCTRILYWSNPEVSYNGDPTGIAEGQANAADNRKTLNNTAYTVANFRQSSSGHIISNLLPAIGTNLGPGRITGRVLQRGVLVSGVTLNLRFYDGIAWSSLMTTTTGTDGTYLFMGAPGLDGGQSYYVRYLNSMGTTGRLYFWRSNTIQDYSSGSIVKVADFDIADLPLVSPANNATVSLPATYQWTRRTATPTDSYELNLYDPIDADPWWWTEYDLGYADRYTMVGLPAGFYTGTPYTWEVWVYNSGGYGISKARGVTFNNSVSSGIMGRVLEKGSGVSGVALDLRFWNGSSWSTQLSTTSGSNGVYQFSGAPSLIVGQKYYVRYDNPTNTTTRIGYWRSNDIEEYTAGTNYQVNDFDITNIALTSPAPDATVSLPRTFQWTVRSGVPTDSYEWDLFDPYDGDPSWWTYPTLGYVGGYTLSGLPSGFYPYVTYGWDVYAYGPGGYGYSYYYREVTFLNTGAQDLSLPASSLKPFPKQADYDIPFPEGH
jgi:hypothetical protein